MFVFAKQIADEKFIGILSDTLTRKEVITTTTPTTTIISKTKSFLIVWEKFSHVLEWNISKEFFLADGGFT